MERLSSQELTHSDLSLLYRVTTSIQSICDLEEMLQVILTNIKESFEIEGASIVLHDSEKREFYFLRSVEAQSGKESARLKKMRFPDDLGIAGWVMREGKTVVIQNVTHDPRFYSGLNQKDGFVTKSMICVPLKTRKRFIGVLYALNKIHGEFSSREARLLEILATPIATSIENATLYGELKRHAQFLEEQNRAMALKAQEEFNKQGIIGKSPAMQRIFSLLGKVIQTPTTVLILGETGTGKELIARVIHYSGPLRNRPFVAENCGALPENILESELFGHVKGAFTGAIQDKKGLFELANGGTIFLDEIGELGLAMQVKLLRVLQEGQIRPVGGSRFKKVNVRIIASTNRDLEEEVKKGNFRQDLYYRINVFPIVLPPLRKRREDIPLLVHHFMKKISKKLDWPMQDISPRAMDLLCHYDWPGNIRQLENEIERAMILASNSKLIDEEHLSSQITSLGGDHAPPKDNTLKEAIEALEKRMIKQALEKSGGNRTKAAKALGLTRQGLLNKITRYGIEV